MTTEANCGTLACVNPRTKVMLGRYTSCSWSLSSPPPPWLRTRYVDSSPISLLQLYLGRSEVGLQISFLLEITFWTLERLYIFIFSRAVSSASSGWTERVSAPGATPSARASSLWSLAQVLKRGDWSRSTSTFSRWEWCYYHRYSKFLKFRLSLWFHFSSAWSLITTFKASKYQYLFQGIMVLLPQVHFEI